MSKTRRPSGRYRETEVRALVESYAAALEAREVSGAGLRALISVADLKRAWRRLRLEDQRVLLAMGIQGASSYQAAEALEKSPSWAQKRYRLALEELTWLMNGGI